MNRTSGGALLMIGGAIALIMAVKGSWENVWNALSGKPPPKKTASSEASFTFGPGGVSSSGGGMQTGPTGGGSPNAPHPLAGSYSSVESGLTFAGVDQGVDFTGRGSVFSLAQGIITRVERAGSGWPGEGALLVERLTSGDEAGKYVYVAEDFAPRVGLGDHVARGSLLGLATGSGRAPGIEIGWADASGHPIAPLYPNPHSPKPAGYDFQAFVQRLSSGHVQGSGVLA